MSSMSCTSSVALSNKRLRFDDEYTASTYDPVTTALGKLCRFEQGFPDPMKPLLDLVVDMLPCNSKDRIACQVPLSALMKHCSAEDDEKSFSVDLDAALRLLSYALAAPTVVVPRELVPALVSRLVRIVNDFVQFMQRLNVEACVSRDDDAIFDNGPTSMCLFGESARIRCSKGVAVHCADWTLVCAQPPPLRGTRHAVVAAALCVLAQLNGQCVDVHALLRSHADLVRAVVFIINIPYVSFRVVRQAALFLALSMVQDFTSPDTCLTGLLVSSGALHALTSATGAANPHSIRLTALAVIKNLVDVYPENRRRAAEDTDVVRMLFRILRNAEDRRLHHGAVLTLGAFCCAHGCVDDALAGPTLYDAILTLLGVLGRSTSIVLGVTISDIISTTVRQQSPTHQTAIGEVALPLLGRMLTYASHGDLIYIDTYLALCERGNTANTAAAVHIFVGVLTAAGPCDGGPSLFARGGALRLLKLVGELDNYHALKTVMNRVPDSISPELQRAAHPASGFEDYIQQVAQYILHATVGLRPLEGILRILREMQTFSEFHSATDECPICQTGNQPAAILDGTSSTSNDPRSIVYSACCSKGFHVRCITPWIVSRPVGFDTCPLCRQGFTASISEKWARC